MIETITKPWGQEIKFAHTAHYVGKILEVKAGEALSVQYHKEKVDYRRHGFTSCRSIYQPFK